MFLNILLCFFFLLPDHAVSDDTNFTFNGLSTANLSLDGFAVVNTDGLLQLTDFTSQSKGHAFYPRPLQFRPQQGLGSLTFSTTFVLGIVPQFSNVGANGMGFVISPSKHLLSGPEGRFYGIFNSTTNGNSSNRILAVAFNDVRNNDVEILVNGAEPKNASRAAYFDQGSFKNLSFVSGDSLQAWVEYSGRDMQLNVTISPLNVPKPSRPLLSYNTNLTDMFLDRMYVGFSAASGNAPTSHCVLAWSFKMNGRAQPLDLSILPKLPRIKVTKQRPSVLTILLPFITSVVVLGVITGVVLAVRRKIKFAELLEDWELEYGPHRFSYKELFKATKGFKEKELLGSGGFGRVYRGVLPSSKAEVAVKRVSHDSWQGMREFVAEVVSIGRLRHRNLVQLLGYCRRKGELLLVYDYMPNGSLDRLLFDNVDSVLEWSTRFHIIKGVASGLLYLHEGWEQIVIHRDVKASNVLLDGDLNGRLGDFGLARLYDHGTDPRTTHVVGTMGYLAPELSRTGKATKGTDVYSFGVFLLEVACGRRPVEMKMLENEPIMVDWVLGNWIKGDVLSSADRKLNDQYVVEEIELVLKLGLLCSHPVPSYRPDMRQVMQFLDWDIPLPKFTPEYWNTGILSLMNNEGFDEFVKSYPSSIASGASSSLFLSGGR